MAWYMVWPGKVWHCIWYGLPAWHGIWYGLARYGMVYDIAWWAWHGIWYGLERWHGILYGLADSELRDCEYIYITVLGQNSRQSQSQLLCAKCRPSFLWKLILVYYLTWAIYLLLEISHGKVVEDEEHLIGKTIASFPWLASCWFHWQYGWRKHEKYLTPCVGVTKQNHFSHIPMHKRLSHPYPHLRQYRSHIAAKFKTR